jgi:ABC-2 type transport system ATP-binding protein
MTTAISFDRVTKAYGGLKAVDAVSFTVDAGEMFGLIGPDGAGKTTTIRMACGLLRPDQGQIRVLGRDPIAQHRSITADVGYLSQRFSLYGDLSIDENIAFFAEIHGVRGYQPARDRLLEMTQLSPFRSRRADRLSGGMKQKLALACTLIHEPRLIVLDEPTTGVDPVSRREFWKLLSEFLELGITILVTTPYLDEAERCARVALLHAGRVIAADAPDVLRASLPGRVIEVVTDEADRVGEVVAGIVGVDDVQMFGARAHVRVSDAQPEDTLERIRQQLSNAGVAPRSTRFIPPTLEDVFIARLGAADAVLAAPPA